MASQHSLDEELRSVKLALQAARKKLARQRQLEKNGGLTVRSVHVCLAVWVLSGYNADIALAYACHAQRRSQSQPQQAVDIYDLFNAADLDHVVRVLRGAEPKNASVRSEAARFIAEYQSVDWVKAENYDNGRAPDLAGLVEKYVECCVALGVEPKQAVHPAFGGRHARVGRRGRRFGVRMRQKWKMTLGSVIPAESISREEVRLKVSARVKAVKSPFVFAGAWPRT